MELLEFEGVKLKDEEVPVFLGSYQYAVEEKKGE
jgi:hypothetical protein